MNLSSLKALTPRKKIALAAAAAVVILLAAFLLYRVFFAKPALQVLETGNVEKGSIRGVLVATGIIKSQVGAVVKIGAQTTGRIQKMKVKVGDRVKAGELIALVDDREIRQQISQQQAALVSAQNTLAQVEKTYPERIREARATHDYAKVNAERERELLKHEYTTKDAVDKAESQFTAAEAVLQRLQDEYKTQLTISRSNLEEIQARLRQQEVRMTYTKIYAPIDGVVSDVTAQEGETIVAGLQVANLVTVLDPSRLEMWIYVDETDIGRAAVGQDVEFYVDTFPAKTFKGKIEKIYPQPVVKENIVYYLSTMKISPDDAAYLKPEMTTHVRIITEEKKDILTAPNAAVKFERGKQVAYKVTGKNKVEKLNLKIGIRGEDRTEILSGASEGDILATKIILPVSADAQQAPQKGAMK
ncbi:MAG TPA: efflux RND transporter periplasmic adaptor subunit [Syntrophales bacterium]|nr:efflux RND transporter periplasmic adaptor subunit [Syntrophales bacterium]